MSDKVGFGRGVGRCGWWVGVVLVVHVVKDGQCGVRRVLRTGTEVLYRKCDKTSHWSHGCCCQGVGLAVDRVCTASLSYCVGAINIMPAEHGDGCNSCCRCLSTARAANTTFLDFRGGCSYCHGCEGPGEPSID